MHSILEQVEGLYGLSVFDRGKISEKFHRLGGKSRGNRGWGRTPGLLTLSTDPGTMSAISKLVIVRGYDRRILMLFR